MATQSIFKNIVINDPSAAEIFVSAVEKASETAKHSRVRNVESEDLSGESLKNFLRTMKH